MVAFHSGTAIVKSGDRKRRLVAGGWTLIELSIALFIITLLSGFAIPSYREHIARGHRVAAVDALQAMVLAVEFATLVDQVGSRNADTDTLPAFADRLVPPYGRPVYRISLLAGSLAAADVSVKGYVVRASPVPQGPQAHDACGTFSVDATGARSNHHANGQLIGQLIQNAESCWRGGRAPSRPH